MPLEALATIFAYMPSMALTPSIRRGDLALMELIVTVDPLRCSPEHFDLAAGSGRLDMVTFLHRASPAGCTTDAMDHAASRGYFDIVQYVHANRTEGCTSKAMDGAAAGGHIEIVRFLHANRTEGYSVLAFEKAVRRGQTEMVSLLLEIVPEKCNVDKCLDIATRLVVEETVGVMEAGKAKARHWRHARDPRERFDMISDAHGFFDLPGHEFPRFMVDATTEASGVFN